MNSVVCVRRIKKKKTKREKEMFGHREKEKYD